MATVTLRPSGDGTTTGWTVSGGTGSHASAIVDDPDSNDADTSYVLSPNAADGTMYVQLDDVPADFDPAAINSITIKLAHRRLNTPQMAVDAGTVNAFITRADEITAISTTPTAVDSPIQAGYALTSFTPSPTGTHTVAEWNGARLALVFDHTNAQTADTVNQSRITAAEVTIDYTPAAASQEVGGAHIATTVSLLAATVAAGAVAVGTAFLASALSLFVPTITVGSVEVGGAHIASTAALNVPTVSQAGGAQAVTGVHIASGVALNVPTVAPGAVTVTGTTLASSVALNVPSVAPGAVTVVGAHKASTVALNVPTVVPGDVEVVGANLASTVALNVPTVSQGAASQAVDGATVASTVVLYSGTVTVGDVETAGATIVSTATLYAPAVDQGVEAVPHCMSSGLLFSNYDVTTTAPDYMWAQFSRPSSAPKPAKTVGLSASLTEVTPGDDPFSLVSVGDLLHVNRDGTHEVVACTSKTDDANIGVDEAVDWEVGPQGSAGRCFSTCRFLSGTTANDGWFRASPRLRICVVVNTINAASITCRIEGRIAGPFATGTLIDTRTFTSTGSNTFGLANAMWDEVRVGLQVAGDSGAQSVTVSAGA